MPSSETPAAWYVINYIAPALRRRDKLTRAIETHNRLNPDSPLTLFAPTFVEAVRRDGKITLVERPLTYHYIFIHGTLQAVKTFCNATDGASFVLSRATGDPASPSTRYLTVTPPEMHSFRIIARAYGNRLPFLPAAQADLMKGDEVEVVSGPFAGLRGIFQTRRGTADGHVVIAVDQALATIAYDIKSDNIRILRFAPDSRSPYDHLDAFLPRLLSAYRLPSNPLPPSTSAAPVPTAFTQKETLRSRSCSVTEQSSGEGSLQPAFSLHLPADDRPLSPSILAPLITFTRRYGQAEGARAKIDAKLQALLLAAATILGDTDLAAHASSRLTRLLPSVTNPWTLSFINLLRALALIQTPVASILQPSSSPHPSLPDLPPTYSTTSTNPQILLREGYDLISSLPATTSSRRLLLTAYRSLLP